MQKQFTLPGTSCSECYAKLVTVIETKRFTISSLKIKCTQCDWSEDILEKGTEKIEANTEYLKQASREIADNIVKLRHTLPKDRAEWGKVVKDPKHPLTAFLLSGLAILLMELSGFGIFMAVTWILGNLILNPIGWVLVPIVIAIAFAYRRYFKKEHLNNLKTKLSELQAERDKGKLSKDEFQMAKDKLFEEYFE